MGFRSNSSCTGGLLLNPFVSALLHENEEDWGGFASHANSVRSTGLEVAAFYDHCPYLFSHDHRVLSGDHPSGDAVSSTVPVTLIIIWICSPCGSADSC